MGAAQHQIFVRTLGSTADGAGVAAEGDGLLLLLDVLKEGDSALQLPAVDGLGGLAGVLERNSEVGTAGAGRLGGSDLGGSVPNLFVGSSQGQPLNRSRSILLVVAQKVFVFFFFLFLHGAAPVIFLQHFGSNSQSFGIGIEEFENYSPS